MNRRPSMHFRTEFAIDDGLRETADWYREAGWI